MNKAVKQIIYELECYRHEDACMLILYKEENNALLDYITNLQQKYEEANDSITWWTNRFKAVERDNKELKEELEEEKRIEEADLKTIQNLEEENERIEKEYKSKVDDIGKLTSRIYKAIEYIEKEIYYCLSSGDNINIYLDQLLNILQNGSEENE